ncbi:MAG: DUF3349 domain-containing protein [Thermoleophilia bacterium]
MGITPSRANDLVVRVVAWLRAGYPGGVPRQDYVALLGILQRRLTDTEVDQVVGALAQEAEAGAVITEDDIRQMIRDQVHETAPEEDVARVAARLAQANLTVDSDR